MNYALVGLYGVFLVFVGMNGNGATLKNDLQTDLKPFLPWFLAIVVLRALYSVDSIKPVVKPFMYLALLTFTLKNYGKIVTQINEIGGLKLPGGN